MTLDRLLVCIVCIICCSLLESSAASVTRNAYVYSYDSKVVTLADGLANTSGFRFTAKATLALLFKNEVNNKNSIDNNELTSENNYLYRLSIENPNFYPLNNRKQANEYSTFEFNSVPLAINSKTSKHLFNNDYHLYVYATSFKNKSVQIQQVYTHSNDVTTFKNIKKAILVNLLPSNNHLIQLEKATNNAQPKYSSTISTTTTTTTENDRDNTNHHNKHHVNTNQVLLNEVSPSMQQHLHLQIDKDKSNELAIIDNNGIVIDDNTYQQPELFSPNAYSSVKLSVEPIDTNNNNNIDEVDRLLFKFVAGQQNVSFGSRIYKQGTSNVTTSFELKLESQLKAPISKHNDVKLLSSVNSIKEALAVIASLDGYQLDSVELERERRICSQHHCEHSLEKLFNAYKENLTDQMLATVETSIAQLRILNSIRNSYTTQSEIMSMLKSATISKKTRGKFGLQSSFLDILANARTKDSITAALKHLKLPTNQNLDIAERFLTTLSVSAKTSAKMRLQRSLKSPYSLLQTKHLNLDLKAKAQRSRIASNEFIAKELIKIITKVPTHSWKSEKLRWSSLLTLATLVNARNIELQFKNSLNLSNKSSFSFANDELNSQTTQILINELSNCEKNIDGTDCRIVVLQAIGNLGILQETQFSVLRDHVLLSGGREAISSMKVLRDLLQICAGEHLSLSFYSQLKDLLIRVVYDQSHETTSRILAAEMIVRFVPDSLASEQVLMHLPLFGNNELATMIYLRMSSINPHVLRTSQQENWYWYSSIINGTSASFIRTMAKTESLNASYGVNVELLNNGKLLKESSFDLFLDTSNKIQDVFSLGIFARGLSSFAGGDSSSSSNGKESDEESATVGMTLRILGGYLRPYVFFNGIGQLLSHIWSGTASDPTTVFNGNLLLIDHEDAYPLISGFVSEQQMRGILSIDVSGKISISMWNKNAHSEVQTRAAVIVHGSQSVFTAYDDFWHQHFFSFGGEALVDFVSDLDFYGKPFKICLQVTQPEFKIRYNSRRHEQNMSGSIERKLVRKNHLIEAKSYSLNAENNKMCSAMFEND